MASTFVARALVVGMLGGTWACGGDFRQDPPEPDGGSQGLSGAGSTPNPDVQTLATCNVEEPCPSNLSVQLIENSSHDINPGVACLFAALAERRVGRYRLDTNSTFSNGSAGAYHTLVVAADGSVAYASQTYRYLSGNPELDALPPGESLRCTLKPASYFESCGAAVAASDAGTARLPPVDDSGAWSCAFGDGDAIAPSHLFWFASCASEQPLRCD